jgi:hypothetical protein
MIEPWFNPNMYAWIPGTALGVLGGTWGALVGVLAPHGRGRRLVFGCGALLVLAAITCLVAGIYALVTGQPYGVWYGLGLPGVIGLLVLTPNLWVVRNVYRAGEARRMAAHDVPL